MSGPGPDAAPDSSAVRTALRRALHVEVDAPPHLIDDGIGLALADPEEGWRDRPDMHPVGTSGFRAAIVARTRFVEDLVVDEGIGQYVLLGAGLDTACAIPSSPIAAARSTEPGPQEWKRQAGRDRPRRPRPLHLVPVDRIGRRLVAGAVGLRLRRRRPGGGVPRCGVSMYITAVGHGRDAAPVDAMAPGSLVVMTFMLPRLASPSTGRIAACSHARRRRRAGGGVGGPPWISHFAPDEIVALAREAGFADVRYVPTDELADRYLADRSDGLRPAGGEGVLVART